MGLRFANQSSPKFDIPQEVGSEFAASIQLNGVSRSILDPVAPGSINAI